MGFRRGMSEVPHGVPMIGSRSILAVRYGDTTAMSADGRDEVDPEVSCMEGQLDRQVYGSAIELAKTRPRPSAVIRGSLNRPAHQAPAPRGSCPGSSPPRPPGLGQNRPLVTRSEFSLLAGLG